MHVHNVHTCLTHMDYSCDEFLKSVVEKLNKQKRILLKILTTTYTSIYLLNSYLCLVVLALECHQLHDESVGEKVRR